MISGRLGRWTIHESADRHSARAFSDYNGPMSEHEIDRRRFADSNTTTFAPKWSAAEIEWWAEKMLRPHGLYPEDLGEMLSASACEPKHVLLTDLKPSLDSFVIKVTGHSSESGEIWWHQRKLDLKGRLFEAQRMIVPHANQDRRRGRLLMADLIDTAARLGIRRIEIEAEDVGRYAWARFGFLPDRTAWNYHVRIEARRRLLRSRGEIGDERFAYCASVLDQENPAAIREVVSWTDEVRSYSSPTDRDDLPKPTTLGRALVLEVQAQWFGSFDLDDPESMAIFETSSDADAMKPYDPIEHARRQMVLADLVPDPATDPVFMAAARAAVIAGGNIPWSDRQRARRTYGEAAPEPIPTAGSDDAAERTDLGGAVSPS